MMLRKLARAVTRHFWWKLASLGMAILLWFAVLGEPELVTLQTAPVLYRNLSPSLLLLSDAAASVNRARLRNHRAAKSSSRGHDENRFEQETRAFFARVHEGYLAIAKRDHGRVAVVDARGTPGQTHERIVELVRRKLKL